MERYTIEDLDIEHADFSRIRTSQTGMVPQVPKFPHFDRQGGPPPVRNGSHCDWNI